MYPELTAYSEVSLAHALMEHLTMKQVARIMKVPTPQVLQCQAVHEMMVHLKTLVITTSERYEESMWLYNELVRRYQLSTGDPYAIHFHHLRDLAMVLPLNPHKTTHFLYYHSEVMLSNLEWKHVQPMLECLMLVSRRECDARNIKPTQDYRLWRAILNSLVGPRAK